MQHPRMPPPEEVFNAKSRKKKPAFQGAPVYQRQEEILRGVPQPLPPVMKVTKKTLKRTLQSDVSPSFQQPERSTSDSLPDSSRWADEYRALRRKYIMLEEVNLDVEEELKEVEDEVKGLEDKKLELLDQLVVLEGLMDPSEIESHRQQM